MTIPAAAGPQILWVESFDDDVESTLAPVSADFDIQPMPAIDGAPLRPGNAPFAVLLTGDSAASAECIRAAGGLWAQVPLLAWSRLDIDKTDKIDEYLSPDDGRTAARIAAWCSTPSTDADRLVALFDATQIAALRTSLQDLLGQALAERDGDSQLGHRVAGLAGMLGYRTLGALWNALPEGDPAVLRQETRKIIFAITLSSLHSDSARSQPV